MSKQTTGEGERTPLSHGNLASIAIIGIFKVNSSGIGVFSKFFLHVNLNRKECKFMTIRLHSGNYMTLLLNVG